MEVDTRGVIAEPVVPGNNHGVRVEFIVLQLVTGFVPLAEIGCLDSSARKGRRIDVLLEIDDCLFRRVGKLADIEGVREPPCSVTGVPEYRQVLVTIVQDHFHEGAEVDPCHVSLCFTAHDAVEIQRPGAVQARIEVLPGRVELAVIGANHVQARAESIVIAGELDTGVLRNPLERLYVAVHVTVDREVVDVFDGRRAFAWFVLPIHRRDRDHAAQVEVEIEFDGGIVRVTIQRVECGRDPHRLTTAGVADEGDAIRVDHTVEAVAGFPVPVAPLREVFQQQPAPGIVFFLESRSVRHHIDTRGHRRVDEVFVHRSKDDAAAR